MNAAHLEDFKRILTDECGSDRQETEDAALLTLCNPEVGTLQVHVIRRGETILDVTYQYKLRGDLIPFTGEMEPEDFTTFLTLLHEAAAMNVKRTKAYLQVTKGLRANDPTTRKLFRA